MDIGKGGWLRGDDPAVIIDDGMACWLGGDPLGKGGGGSMNGVNGGMPAGHHCWKA